MFPSPHPRGREVTEEWKRGQHLHRPRLGAAGEGPRVLWIWQESWELQEGRETLVSFGHRCMPAPRTVPAKYSC